MQVFEVKQSTTLADCLTGSLEELFEMLRSKQLIPVKVKATPAKLPSETKSR